MELQNEFTSALICFIKKNRIEDDLIYAPKIYLFLKKENILNNLKLLTNQKNIFNNITSVIYNKLKIYLGLLKNQRVSDIFFPNPALEKAFIEYKQNYTQYTTPKCYATIKCVLKILILCFPHIDTKNSEHFFTFLHIVSLFLALNKNQELNDQKEQLQIVLTKCIKHLFIFVYPEGLFGSLAEKDLCISEVGNQTDEIGIDKDGVRHHNEHKSKMEDKSGTIQKERIIKKKENFTEVENEERIIFFCLVDVVKMLLEIATHKENKTTHKCIKLLYIIHKKIENIFIIKKVFTGVSVNIFLLYKRCEQQKLKNEILKTFIISIDKILAHFEKAETDVPKEFLTNEWVVEIEQPFDINTLLNLMKNRLQELEKTKNDTANNLDTQKKEIQKKEKKQLGKKTEKEKCQSVEQKSDIFDENVKIISNIYFIIYYLLINCSPDCDELLCLCEIILKRYYVLHKNATLLCFLYILSNMFLKKKHFLLVLRLLFHQPLLEFLKNNNIQIETVTKTRTDILNYTAQKDLLNNEQSLKAEVETMNILNVRNDVKTNDHLNEEKRTMIYKKEFLYKELNTIFDNVIKMFKKEKNEISFPLTNVFNYSINDLNENVTQFYFKYMYDIFLHQRKDDIYIFKFIKGFLYYRFIIKKIHTLTSIPEPFNMFEYIFLLLETSDLSCINSISTCAVLGSIDQMLSEDNKLFTLNIYQKGNGSIPTEYINKKQQLEDSLHFHKFKNIKKSFKTEHLELLNEVNLFFFLFSEERIVINYVEKALYEKWKILLHTEKTTEKEEKEKKKIERNQQEEKRETMQFNVDSSCWEEKLKSFVVSDDEEEQQKHMKSKKMNIEKEEEKDEEKDEEKEEEKDREKDEEKDREKDEEKVKKKKQMKIQYQCMHFVNFFLDTIIITLVMYFQLTFSKKSKETIYNETMDSFSVEFFQNAIENDLVKTVFNEYANIYDDYFLLAMKIKFINFDICNLKNVVKKVLHFLLDSENARKGEIKLKRKIQKDELYVYYYISLLLICINKCCCVLYLCRDYNSLQQHFNKILIYCILEMNSSCPYVSNLSRYTCVNVHHYLRQTMQHMEWVNRSNLNRKTHEQTTEKAKKQMETDLNIIINDYYLDIVTSYLHKKIVTNDSLYSWKKVITIANFLIAQNNYTHIYKDVASYSIKYTRRVPFIYLNEKQKNHIVLSILNMFNSILYLLYKYIHDQRIQVCQQKNYFTNIEHLILQGMINVNFREYEKKQIEKRKKNNKTKEEEHIVNIKGMEKEKREIVGHDENKEKQIDTTDNKNEIQNNKKEKYLKHNDDEDDDDDDDDDSCRERLYKMNNKKYASILHKNVKEKKKKYFLHNYFFFYHSKDIFHQNYSDIISKENVKTEYIKKIQAKVKEIRNDVKSNINRNALVNFIVDDDFCDNISDQNIDDTYQMEQKDNNINNRKEQKTHRTQLHDKNNLETSNNSHLNYYTNILDTTRQIFNFSIKQLCKDNIFIQSSAQLCVLRCLFIFSTRIYEVYSKIHQMWPYLRINFSNNSYSNNIVVLKIISYIVVIDEKFSFERIVSELIPELFDKIEDSDIYKKPLIPHSIELKFLLNVLQFFLQISKQEKYFEQTHSQILCFCLKFLNNSYHSNDELKRLCLIIISNLFLHDISKIGKIIENLILVKERILFLNGRKTSEKEIMQSIFIRDDVRDTAIRPQVLFLSCAFKIENLKKIVSLIIYIDLNMLHFISLYFVFLRTKYKYKCTLNQHSLVLFNYFNDL